MKMLYALKRICKSNGAVRKTKDVEFRRIVGSGRAIVASIVAAAMLLMSMAPGAQANYEEEPYLIGDAKGGEALPLSPPQILLGGDLLRQPVGFYDNATTALVGPDGNITIEGGNRFSDTGLIYDIVPGPDGRIDALIVVVGEPSLAHEGGAANTTYLEMLHARHQMVKDQMLQCEINITFLGDTYFASNILHANVLAADVPTIRTLENVSAVRQSLEVKLTLDHSGPTIRANELRALRGVDGSGITIALIDTGVDITHEALDDLNDDPGVEPSCAYSPPGGNCKVKAFQDFTDGDPFDDDWPPSDDIGHGTQVAGIAAGTRAGTPYEGIAPGATLVVAKVFKNDNGNVFGYWTWVLQAYDWISTLAVDPPIRIVSMSLGDEMNSDGATDEELGADNLVDSGFTVVVSAGNVYPWGEPSRHTVGRPATAKKVVSVGASNDLNNDDRGNDYLEYWSARGPTGDYRIKPDVTAPGTQIISPAPGGGYDPDFGGTSASAPHISGLAALLLQAHPGQWSPREVKASIINTASDFTWTLYDIDAEPTSKGGGLVDAIEADAAESLLWGAREPDEVMLSFGSYVLSEATGYTLTISEDTRLKNINGQSGTYDLSLYKPDFDAQPDLDAELSLDSIYLPGGGEGQVTLTIRIDAPVPEDYYDGNLIAINRITGELLRLPFMIHIMPAILHVDPQLTSKMSFFFAILPRIPQSAVFKVTDPFGGLHDVWPQGWSEVYPAHWCAVGSFSATTSGLHIVAFDLEDHNGFHGIITGSFVADIDPPTLSIRVQDSGPTSVRIQVTSTEQLATGWLDDQPIYFSPHMSWPITFGDIMYPVDLAASGREVHVVWYEHFGSGDSWRILYQKSDDFGRTWDNPFAIAQTGGGASEPVFPRLAVEGQNVHIAWDDSNTIWYRRSLDDGTSWENPVQISDVPHAYHAPSISVFNGQVHVAWADYRDWPWPPNRDPDSAIYYASSPDNGLTWGSPRRLTFVNPPYESWLPGILATESAVHLVLDDNRLGGADGEGDVFYMKSSNGGLSWDPEQPLTQGPSTMRYPKIAGEGENLHVVFNHLDDIGYERSVDDGAQWDDGLGHSHIPRLLTSQDPAPCKYGAFANIASGGEFVESSWKDASGCPTNFFGYAGWSTQESHSGNMGREWTPQSAVSEEVTMFPVLSNDDGSPIGFDFINEPSVAWKDMFGRNRFIYYTRYLEPRVRLVRSDGRVDVLPLSGSGSTWEVVVDTDATGLLTAEAIGFDAAGNWDNVVTYFGNVEFEGPGDKTESVYLDPQWQFTESRMAIASLSELDERPERTDQINDVETDLNEAEIVHGHRQGQSFRPADVRLSSVELMLAKNAIFQSDLVIEVQTDDGGIPSGTVLTSAPIANEDIPAQLGWVHVDVPDIPTVVNQVYHLVARADPEPAPCDPAHMITCEQFTWDWTSDVYVHGEKSLYLNGQWSIVSGYDRKFHTVSNALEADSRDQSNDIQPGVNPVSCTYRSTMQSFRPVAHSISAASIRIRRESDTSYDLWVEIAESAGGTPGVVKARSYLQTAQIPTTEDWVTVDMANVQVIPGNLYYLVLRPGGLITYPPPMEEQKYCWRLQDDTYVGGGAFELVGGVWSPTGGDHIFEILAADLNTELRDQTSGTISDSARIIAGNSEPKAQGFIPTSGILSKVSLMLTRTNDLNWNLEVSVVEEAGGQPGTLPAAKVRLGPGSIPLVQPILQLVDVDFQNVKVDPSKTYYIVLTPKPVVTPLRGTVMWYSNTHDIYVKGRAMEKVGGFWRVTTPSSLDMIFVSYTADRASEQDDQFMTAPSDDVSVIDANTHMLAQTFHPTSYILSSASLLLCRSHNMAADILVEIRKASGAPLDFPETRIMISSEDVPDETLFPEGEWTTADFADIHVTPGEDLSLVLTTVGSIPSPEYVKWWSVSSGDYYPSGESWFNDGGWQELPSTDLEFQVFGANRRPERLDQSQGEAVDFSVLPAGGLAQSFRPFLPILSSVDIMLARGSGYDERDVIVEIRRANGNVPSAVVEARVLIPFNLIPIPPYPPPEPVSVPLSDILVDTADDYFIVAYPSSGTGAVLWGAMNYNIYALGSAAYWDESGPYWVPLLFEDYAFQTHGRGYPQTVTDPWIRLGTQLTDPIIWPIPPIVGEFYGSAVTDDFTWELNQRLAMAGPPDEFGYVRIYFVFHSASAGALFVWAERLEF